MTFAAEGKGAEGKGAEGKDSAPRDQFSESELVRYDQQLSISGWDETHQLRLRDASVFVVGLGALGSPVTAYLAGAGVGRLGLIDGGDVDLPELYRQFLHYTPEVETGKAESAAAKVALLNPNTRIDMFPADVDASNVDMILDGANLVIDCTRDATARGLLSQSCVRTQTPLLALTASGLVAHTAAYLPGQSVCIECAFSGLVTPAEPPFGPVSGVIGSIAALGAIKLIADLGPVNGTRILSYDAGQQEISRSASTRRPDCSCT
ncbi:MAG: HesA/MoeB/ThiF family protein [Solirubrobacterales bacterium]